MIFADRYLTADRRCSSLLLNVVNTSGEYLFGRYVVEHGRRRCTAPAPASAGGAAAVHRRDLQQLLQLREPDRLPAADVRRVAACSSSSASAASLFIHPIVALDRLPDDAARAVVRGDALAEDRRQQPSTTRSATRPSRRCGCRPAARRSTRPSRRSIRSACAPATCCRRASSTPASWRRSACPASRRVNVVLRASGGWPTVRASAGSCGRKAQEAGVAEHCEAAAG